MHQLVVYRARGSRLFPMLGIRPSGNAAATREARHASHTPGPRLRAPGCDSFPNRPRNPTTGPGSQRGA